MLRTAQSLPHRALDAGLRPGPFPDQAASLLPGLLAATRTGLTPAGDDELMSDQPLNQHLQHWAYDTVRDMESPATGVAARVVFRAPSGVRALQGWRVR